MVHNYNINNLMELKSIKEQRESKPEGPPPMRSQFLKEKNLNLCPYVRRVVSSILFIPFALVAKGFQRIPFPKINTPSLPEISWTTEDRIKRGLTAIGYAGGAILLGLGILYIPKFAIVVAVFAGIVAGVVGLIYLIRSIIEHTRHWRRNHPLPEIHGPSTPKLNGLRQTLALIKAYFQARHEKVCPCLERVK